jgi:signal transduction histidine kinase
MQERASRLGGTLRLEPRDPGTAVVAELPLLATGAAGTPGTVVAT